MLYTGGGWGGGGGLVIETCGGGVLLGPDEGVKTLEYGRVCRFSEQGFGPRLKTLANRSRKNIKAVYFLSAAKRETQ